jgi:hypothetical protein
MLIKEILKKFNNQNNQKYFHYSAHDTTLLTITSTLLLEDNPMLIKSPGYISSYIFELHNINNELFIKVLYSTSYKDEWIELKLPSLGCNDFLCKFDTFVK